MRTTEERYIERIDGETETDTTDLRAYIDDPGETVMVHVRYGDVRVRVDVTRTPAGDAVELRIASEEDDAGALRDHMLTFVDADGSDFAVSLPRRTELVVTRGRR